MKTNTIQTLLRIVRERKIYAMQVGHYPPPYTAEAFDNRGPVFFRSIAYGQTIIEINALKDAIETLSVIPLQTQK